MHESSAKQYSQQDLSLVVQAITEQLLRQEYDRLLRGLELFRNLSVRHLEVLMSLFNFNIVIDLRQVLHVYQTTDAVIE